MVMAAAVLTVAVAMSMTATTLAMAVIMTMPMAASLTMLMIVMMTALVLFFLIFIKRMPIESCCNSIALFGIQKSNSLSTETRAANLAEKIIKRVGSIRARKCYLKVLCLRQCKGKVLAHMLI